MKLSFSLALLAAAALSVQAAVTPNAAGTCISGSSGKHNGDGYKGYCCVSSDDCFESCVKGVCNGPAPPTKTSQTTSTKTTSTKPTTTPGTCTKGSSGLGQGDGYNGYCCKTSDDCFESCIKGVCNGPAPPTKTTSVPTSTATPGTCTKGSSGLGQGDGYNGYCCKTSDDCFESCIKGVCNGPAPPTKTTSVPTSTATPGTCTKGSSGLGQGDGYNGYCCETSDDCFESCIKGVCNGPAPPTKTTSVPTSTATPGTCTKGSSGLGQGDGYNGYCCETSDDCFESCVKGVCNGPAPPSKTSSTPVPTGGAECKAGFKGKKNGQGPKDACCSTQADCQESCIKGKCN